MRSHQTAPEVTITMQDFPLSQAFASAVEHLRFSYEDHPADAITQAESVFAHQVDYIVQHYPDADRPTVVKAVVDKVVSPLTHLS